MRTTELLALLSLAAGSAFGQITVMNGAALDPGQPMAPGSIALIAGQNLCGKTVAAAGSLKTSLGGCSVTVNGTPALMQYVSAGRCSFLLPQNLQPGPATVMMADGSHTQTATITVAPSGPAIFSMNGMGMGDGAMLNGHTWQAGPFSMMTAGQPTQVAIYMTGLDLSAPPTVSMGGMAAQVVWYGNAPGYPGLQQINVAMPAGAAGAGRIPVTVTSAGQTSNAMYMTVLPTTAMMQGMPGWNSGMSMHDNMARGHELSSIAFNPANNTVLVADQNDDVVRVISLSSKTTTATIALPQHARAQAVAVNGAGTLAAVALSEQGSVALIDLAQNTAVAVIATGNYPSHLAFSGSSLLVTNGASGTLSVIDTAAGSVTQTVNVGFGASGVAAANGVAVVANMQSGSLSVVNLTSYAVVNIALPAGSRPMEVAASPALNKALVTTPMTNGYLLVNLQTNAVTPVAAGTALAMGPGAVAVNGNLAFVANQMTASVTAVDMAAGTIQKTFSVDPGPRALAVDPAANQLLVLAEGTGTLDVVDLGTYGINARLAAGDTERHDNWNLPAISSLTPNSAAAGSASFTLTITGTNFQGLKGVEFDLAGTHSSGMGGGMGSGMGHGGMGSTADPNIAVSNVQVNAAGTQISATVQVSAAAAAGPRWIRLSTSSGMAMMGNMGGTLFTVTAQ